MEEGSSAHPKPKKQLSKKRLELDKRVVKKVKLEAKTSDQFPPSDSWSWRKFGQKPIKGSPYPRGYYKCTTSKGCLAKKTVEKSKDDGSMVIITYTTDHNHTGPDSKPTCSKAQRPIKAQPTPSTKTADQEEEKPYVVRLEKNWSQLMMSLSSGGGENEILDELGELPNTSASAASSSFTSFMKNYFFDELMLVPHPLSNQLQ